MRFRRRRDVNGNGLAKATAERQKSEERFDAVMKHVVDPLKGKGRRNQFAEQLRALMEGGPR